MERISAAEYRARHKAKRKGHKYGALPAWRCEACGAGATAYGACLTCGETLARFDSRAEAKRFDLLHSMERTRMISDLRRQVHDDVVGAADPLGCDAFAAQVVMPARLVAMVVVDDDLRVRVVVQRVHREVAPHRVLLGGAEDVVAGDEEIAVRLAGVLGHVGRVLPEGRHLDDLAPVHHVREAEAAADDPRAAEQGADFFGRGAGGHVEILGGLTDNDVAHRATDDIGLEAGALERVHHVERAAIDQRGVDAVHGGRHILALAEFRALARGALAQQLVDEGLDHADSGNRSRMRQPRCCAISRRAAPGLVATGLCARSSSGRSLVESE